MAGLEVVVRPVVFPNIRPAQARPLAPADDPTKGVATLSGQGGKFIDLACSEQHNWSKSKTVETERRFDVERIYQKEKNPETGKEEINKENYVDVERLTKLKERDSRGVETEHFYARPDDQSPDRVNIEILERDVTTINVDAPKPPPAANGGGSAP